MILVEGKLQKNLVFLFKTLTIYSLYGSQSGYFVTKQLVVFWNREQRNQKVEQKYRTLWFMANFCCWEQLLFLSQFFPIAPRRVTSRTTTKLRSLLKILLILFSSLAASLLDMSNGLLILRLWRSENRIKFPPRPNCFSVNLFCASVHN